MQKKKRCERSFSAQKQENLPFPCLHRHFEVKDTFVSICETLSTDP